MAFWHCWDISTGHNPAHIKHFEVFFCNSRNSSTCFTFTLLLALQYAQLIKTGPITANIIYGDLIRG